VTKAVGETESTLRCRLVTDPYRVYAKPPVLRVDALFVSTNRTANPFDLHGEELAVIAAVVLGGTNIMGGSGNVFGVFLGVLLTVIINNSLVLIGVPSYWQKATFGCLIIVATVFQMLKDRKKAKYC